MMSRKYSGLCVLGTICCFGVFAAIFSLPTISEDPAVELPEAWVGIETEQHTDRTDIDGSNTPEPVEPHESAPAPAVPAPAPAAPAPVLQDFVNYPVMGKLIIESLELELPILAEFSYDGLKSAPCLYAGPSSPEHAGNIVIVGHDYKRHFSPLKRLEAGRSVILLDKYGTEYKYEVYELVTIAPNQVEVLEEYEGDQELSLLTCTDKGKNRLLVRCRAIF